LLLVLLLLLLLLLLLNACGCCVALPPSHSLAYTTRVDQATLDPNLAAIAAATCAASGTSQW
jgi:hypothetical protein